MLNVSKSTPSAKENPNYEKFTSFVVAHTDPDADSISKTENSALKLAPLKTGSPIFYYLIASPTWAADSEHSPLT